MIKRILFAAAMLGALATASVAADLPTKAAPAPASKFSFSNGYDGNGFYFGILGQGGAGSVSSSAPGMQGSLTSTYGNVGGLLGYNFTVSPTVYGFIEYDLTYQNLGGSSGFGLSFNGPLSMDFVAAVGVPLDAIMTFIPLPTGVSFPSLTLPGGATAKNMHPYLGFDGHLYDASAALGLNSGKEWIFQPGVAIGMKTQYSNNMTTDTRLSIFGAGNSFCIGPFECVKPGMTILGTAALDF
jgi:hypothetical protein